MQEISVQELQTRLNAADQPLLLDVRESWEFSLCHIDGSTSIPMGNIPNVLDELDPRQETVVICHHGVRSRHVCQFLAHSGFSNLYNLTGGVQAWASEIDTQMPTY